MPTARSRSAARQKRHSRLRLRVAGSAERPRLAVFRSINQIYAQVIDDEAGKAAYLNDTRDLFHGASPLVLRPASTDEVALACRASRQSVRASGTRCCSVWSRSINREACCENWSADCRSRTTWGEAGAGGRGRALGWG